MQLLAKISEYARSSDKKELIQFIGSKQILDLPISGNRRLTWQRRPRRQRRPKNRHPRVTCGDKGRPTPPLLHNKMFVAPVRAGCGNRSNKTLDNDGRIRISTWRRCRPSHPALPVGACGSLYAFGKQLGDSGSASVSHPRSPNAERSTPGGAYHPAEP